MTELARAEVVIGGDNSRLLRALAVSESRMKSAGSRLQGIGRRMSASVTLPLAAIGAAATKAFSDFDSAMTQSTAIMGDVSDVMRNQIAAAAREVGRSTTIGSTQAAESFFFLASAGLDAQQSIAALPQVAAFAQAGMFDMSRATDLATDAQSALGLTMDDAAQNMENLTRVTDVLVKANTLANATVEQFSTALTSQAGAAMRTFNIDIEEGTAVLAALADQGVKAQRAGMGLSRILRLMSQAATQNAGAMEELGIEFFDAEGNMLPLADVIENLTNVLGPMSDAQRSAALESVGFSARVQGMLLPLLGTSDAIREYEAGLREAAGTTQEVADNQLQSFAAQIEIAKNNVVIAAQAIGKVLAPSVLRVAQFLSNAAQRIAEANPRALRLGVAFAAIAAAIGPATIALGLFLSTAGSVIGAISTAIGLFGGAAAAVGTFVAALNPVTVAVAAIGLALVTLQADFSSLGAFVRSVWDLIVTGASAAFEGLINIARPVINTVVGYFRFLGLVAAGIWREFIREPFLRAFRTIRDFGGRILGALAKGLEFVGGVAQGTADRIAEAFRKAGEEAQDEGTKLGQILGDAATESFGVNYVGEFVGLVRSGVERAQGMIDSAFERLHGLGRPVGGGGGAEAEAAEAGDGAGGRGLVGEVVPRHDIQDAFEVGENAVEEFGETSQDVAKSVEGAFSNAFSQVITGSKSMGDAFEDMGKRILSMLARMISKALVFKAVSAAFPGAGGLLGGVFGGGVSFFQQGGFFRSGQSFIAGEAGPELIVPQSSGRVVPNEQVRDGGGDLKLEVNVPPARDPISFARDVQWQTALSESIKTLRERGADI